MCYPELDSLYTEFLSELAIFRSEITDLVCLNRDKRDRYKNIYEKDNNGTLVLVYISSQSKQILKIIINYNMDCTSVVTSIFSEDTAIQAILQMSKSFINISRILTEINTHVAQDRVIMKLKYGI